MEMMLLLLLEMLMLLEMLLMILPPYPKGTRLFKGARWKAPAKAPRGCVQLPLHP